MGRIRSIFDIEKLLWKLELCCFWPSILKWPKGQKYFHGRFHNSLALLIKHYTQLLAEKWLWVHWLSYIYIIHIYAVKYLCKFWKSLHLALNLRRAPLQQYTYEVKAKCENWYGTLKVLPTLEVHAPNTIQPKDYRRVGQENLRPLG